MTYSLNTLNASAAAKSPPRTGAARFGHEVSLLVGLLALIFWLLALVSYSAQDPSWSSSGAGLVAHGGQLGGAPGGVAGRWQLLCAGLFGVVVRGSGRVRLVCVVGAVDARW